MTLSLAFNNIRREGALALAAAFTAQHCCPSLAIDLRSNNFLFSGTKAIRDAYKSDQSPKHFILHCEKITEQPEKSSQSSAHELGFFRQYPDAPRAEDSAYIRGVWPRPPA